MTPEKKRRVFNLFAAIAIGLFIAYVLFIVIALVAGKPE
jgi:hypothetical protein